MTRYFMHPEEAAALIVEAAALSDGDGVFMLDMGDRIRIEDLAYKMIRLRGLRPNVDIAIDYTGLRPGEKLTKNLSTGMSTGKTRHIRACSKSDLRRLHQRLRHRSDGASRSLRTPPSTVSALQSNSSPSRQKWSLHRSPSPRKTRRLTMRWSGGVMPDPFEGRLPPRD